MAKINLSPELVEGLLETLNRHDPATRDPYIAMQYLAAVNGFVLAHQELDEAQRREYLDNLNALAKHVLQDVEEQIGAAPQEAPPPQNALGVWRPGDK
jgi:hypothetical protein